MWTWRDEHRFALALNDPDYKAALEAIVASAGEPTAEIIAKSTDVDGDKLHTLGAWGQGGAAT